MTLLLLLACLGGPPRGPSPLEQALAPRPPVAVELPGEVVALQVTLRAGSAFDPPDREGLAWLAAQTVAASGTPDRSPAEVADLLTSWGAELEVQVHAELVDLRLQVLEPQAEEAADLLGELVAHPVLDPAAFERSRAAALRALTDGVLASEERMGAMLLDRWINEGHPYGHAAEGRAGSLERLALSDVEGFLEDAWLLPAAWAGAAGPDAARYAERLAAHLAELPDRPVRSPTPAIRDPVHGRSLLVVDRGSGLTGFHFGHPLELSRADPDWPALALAAAALGEHRRSFGRLYRVLRERRGLNYGDYAYVEAFGQDGWSELRLPGTARRQEQFAAWLRTLRPADAAFALKLALDEVERWVEEGLDPEEFERVRDHLVHEAPVRAATPRRRLGLAMEAAALGLPDPVEDLPRAWSALTVEQVNDAVRRHIRPEDLRIVAVADDAGELAEALRSGEPTPWEPPEGVALSPEERARDAQVAGADIGLDEVFVLPAEGLFR